MDKKQGGEHEKISAWRKTCKRAMGYTKNYQGIARNSCHICSYHCKELVEQCECYGDWQYGEALIRRSYWAKYVQEMLEDTGDIPKDIPWYIAIDWDKTADNVEADYMSVDFDGVEYLIRE